MSKPTQAEKPGATPITQSAAAYLAEQVLDRLDDIVHRGGRAIEYRESSCGGLVRIFRDDGGRVYFRTPRVLEASVRLQVDKSKRIFSRDNKRKLENFLQENPLVLSFLEESRL